MQPCQYIPCHAGDPMCQNGRSCYGGMCDCAPLYNGTSCENGASQNSVILNNCVSFCSVFVWTCTAPSHPSLPFPSLLSPSPHVPQPLVYHVVTGSASMVAAVALEDVNVWTRTPETIASTRTVSWASPSVTPGCMRMAPRTVYMRTSFPQVTPLA